MPMFIARYSHEYSSSDNVPLLREITLPAESSEDAMDKANRLKAALVDPEPETGPAIYDESDISVYVESLISYLDRLQYGYRDMKSSTEELLACAGGE